MFKNYRLVSILLFISKILQKVVLQQLCDHLNAADTLEPFQSAYRSDHSTETLLLRVTNDPLMACGRGSVSILSLLDSNRKKGKEKGNKNSTLRKVTLDTCS